MLISLDKEQLTFPPIKMISWLSTRGADHVTEIRKNVFHGTNKRHSRLILFGRISLKRVKIGELYYRD